MCVAEPPLNVYAGFEGAAPVAVLAAAGVQRIILGCGPMQSSLHLLHEIATDVLHSGHYNAMTANGMAAGVWLNRLFASLHSHKSFNKTALSYTTEEFSALRRFVDTPSGRIAYLNGEPAALFVHGVLVNDYLWRHQLDGLSDTTSLHCVGPAGTRGD